MSGPTSVRITAKKSINRVVIPLPSSKSESNRALIINMFARGVLHNLSEARDTQTMVRLLKSEDKELDVLDAGTTMRFLLAYYALTNQKKILTGTTRMCERPIAILTDALHEIGAQVKYLREDGFPPVETLGFSQQKNRHISIQGDVSSQYISAIMMLGPTLPHGLTIQLKGKVASKPYILMTLELMKKFGANIEYTEEKVIIIQPSKYTASEFTVESDWSGASYWFSFVALAEKAEVVLSGLKPDTLQGDNRIVEIMNPLGVKATFVDAGLLLTKKASSEVFRYDFSQCPDLGQTVAVTCAAKGIPAEFTGLESLRIKETDRIAALQNELKKIGASLVEEDGNNWKLHPSKPLAMTENSTIETYDDHRMAMAFAPLATKMNVDIIEPGVVEKSYPSFWKHLQLTGFDLDFNP